MRAMSVPCVVLLFCLTGLVSQVYAGSWEDKLKEALEEYVEGEIDKASGKLSGEGSEDKVPKPVTVHLKFSGADAPSSEQFTPLSEPERGTTVVLAQPATTDTDPERACFNLVQGKVAWNHSGNNQWSPNNIKRLCEGTDKASEPVSCFKYAMFSGSQWGQTSAHTVTWGEALNLCAGTNNANTVTTCFKDKIKAGFSVNSAINACRSGGAVTPAVALVNPGILHTTPVVIAAANQEEACFNYVQGKIAWDNAGKNKTWSPANVQRLCKGTTSQYSPGNCFQYVLFSGSSWGKRPTDQVGWQQAIDLCEGISNNQETTSCFKNAIGSGKSLDAAIKLCEKK